LGTLPRAAVAALLGAALVAPASASAAGTGLHAYEIRKLDGKDVRALAGKGFDMTEARTGRSVEVVATAAQARGLRKIGLGAKRKASDLDPPNPDGSWNVYRPYFDDTYVGTANGAKRQTLYQELQALAAANTDLIKPEIIGRTVDDKPILALRVTKEAREPTNPDGSRPAVLYSAAQHAREWITPEMDRRLVHYVVDRYRAGDADIVQLLNTTELWFVPVANPDGYDFTFTPGNRLWRKNLRDNNGDGQITNGDGVDLNRNFATNWGYDNEGSSDDPSTDVYRGPGPGSEPETKAMDGLLDRVGFEFHVNYHSAAELLLYPFGFQVETYSADDPIYRALSGTDDDPAIKGNGAGAPDPYDPDVSAELYTTNGETNEHEHVQYGTLGWTPEMDVSDPDRGGGESEFEFQDSDADLQAAFEKNLPFALDVAKSAKDPSNPVSHLGNVTPDFEVERFASSYGDPQLVEANVKRSLGAVTMHFSIDGGPERSAATSEWDGGERYGGPGDVYYHRVRGSVTGTSPGDRVRVWFEAGGERSQAFTYRARSETGNPVLILSAEDYTGKLNSQDPVATDDTGPKYLGYYQDALSAAGVGADVYDVDAEGRTAPDRLGVLSHYKAVLWYTGDDQFIREADAPGGTGVSKLADDEILQVRSYLNEGGKLLYTGKWAGYGELTAFPYNPQGQPPYCDAAEVEDPPGSDPTLIPQDRCALLSNDFLQYYLGAYVNIDAAASQDDAAALPILGSGGVFSTPLFHLNGGGSAGNQSHVYSMVPTSDILPADQFPLFRSDPAASFDRPPAFDPPTGRQYMVASSDDEGWQRLRKTIDLTGATAADLQFKLSLDTEASYDFVVVEAHTVGQDDWTTLPDENGHTSDDVGESCGINWDQLHPFLAHYQGADCSPQGTTGEWNGATGNSGGFKPWKIDLSAYAGKQVEISISYIQDFSTGGLGVFLDDAVLTKDGTVAEQTSFEDDEGGFTAGPAPDGSEDLSQWHRRASVGYREGPGIETDDTVYYGFGLEGVDAATRASLVSTSMRHLGVISDAPPPGGGGGGGGGGTTPPPTGSPAPSPAPSPSPAPPAEVRKVAIRRQTLHAGKNRTFRVQVSCPPSIGSRCSGTLRVVSGKRVIGRRSFKITASKYRSVTAKMTRRDYRTLVKRGRLRVRVTVTTRDDADTLRTKAVRLTLRPARK
jgi:hypothetical protein